MRQVLLSWSGGKDAAWTLHALRQRDDVEVVALLTTVTADYERVAMHGIRREVLHAQAEAVGLPLVEARIPSPCDNATYEAAFAMALVEAKSRWPQADTLAFGDLFLADIRAFREAQCARLGWSPLFPLFGRDTRELAREMIASGMHATLCCVDTTQLDASLSGHDFDDSLLDELPRSCDPCCENGEFHTLVHAGPMFRRPLALIRGESLMREERFAYTDFALA